MIVYYGKLSYLQPLPPQTNFSGPITISTWSDCILLYCSLPYVAKYPSTHPFKNPAFLVKFGSHCRRLLQGSTASRLLFAPVSFGTSGNSPQSPLIYYAEQKALLNFILPFLTITSPQKRKDPLFTKKQEVQC